MLTTIFVLGDAYEVFSKDVKLPKITFKKEKDDGERRLHSARFQRLSILEPEEWYEQAPVMRVDVIKNIPLTHVGGTNCVSEKVIIMMHDRKIALTMKHFIIDNVAVACKPKVTYTGPGGSTHSDFAWVEASTLAQAQEAILNYSVLIHHLYSWDTTGFIIQRVLLKHNWLARYAVMTVRMTIIRTFFDGVLRINAAKASNNRGVPMSYKEQLELMESITDRIHNPSNGGGGGHTAQNSGFKIPRSAASNPGPGRQGAAGPKKEDKRARWNGLLLCYDYNSMKGTVCSRPSTPAGCKDGKGAEFAHKCNMRTSGGNFCKLDHRRADH